MTCNDHIIITGAASGLGKALSHLYAHRGNRVVGLDLDEPGLKKLEAEFAESGLDFRGFVCDVTNWSACVQVFDLIRKHFDDRVDLLLNNAGISHRSAFLETDVEVLRRVLSVNYLGNVHWTKLTLPTLIKSQGNLVSISSVSGYSPLIARTGYSASKYALHGFYESLRSELHGAGVHIMLVCPGFIDTNIHVNALGPDGSKASRNRVTIGEKLTAESVAKAIAKGLKRKKRILFVGYLARLAYWTQKFAPRLYMRIMRQSLQAELGQD